MQSRNQCLELLLRSGLWQRGVAEVIVEVEIVVVHPDRMIELNWRQRQLALKERNKMEPALEMVPEHREDIGICRGRARRLPVRQRASEIPVFRHRKLASSADNLSMASSIRFEAMPGFPAGSHLNYPLFSMTVSARLSVCCARGDGFDENGNEAAGDIVAHPGDDGEA